MACFEKYKRSNASFAIGHSERKYKARDGHIDEELGERNLFYIARDRQYLNERLEALKCCKRSDVNVMAELIVTKPKTFKGTSFDFFDVVFEYAKLLYKEQNIVFAIVHRDEPSAEDHIHIGFVPTYYDKKKKKAVVSYEKCVHNNLDSFHDKLSEYLEKVFGYDVGVLNGATKEGNKTIEQLKRESQLREDTERLERERDKVLKEKEEAMSVDDRIILARYKSENERLKKLYALMLSFIEKSGLKSVFEAFLKKVNMHKNDKEKS